MHWVETALSIFLIFIMFSQCGWLEWKQYRLKKKIKCNEERIREQQDKLLKLDNELNLRLAKIEGWKEAMEVVKRQTLKDIKSNAYYPK